MIHYKNFLIEYAVESTANGRYQARIYINILENGEPVNGFEFPPYPGAWVETENQARQDAEQWARSWIDMNF